MFNESEARKERSEKMNTFISNSKLKIIPDIFNGL